MKKLLLVGAAVLLMTSSASAQSSMPRSIISGNQFCTYGNSGAQWCVPMAVRQTKAAPHFVSQRRKSAVAYAPAAGVNDCSPSAASQR